MPPPPPKSDTLSKPSLALLAAIGASVAAYPADVVFAPLALAVFIIPSSGRSGVGCRRGRRRLSRPQSRCR